MDWSDVDDDTNNDPFNKLSSNLEHLHLPQRENSLRSISQVLLQGQDDIVTDTCNFIEGQKDESGHLKTLDKNSRNTYLVSEDMLKYQGQVYSPTDIAHLWKKDCRTWLWKAKLEKDKSYDNRSKTSNTATI